LSALPRSFHFFIYTRLAGNTANQMLLVALGWQMYDLTGSAWDLGLVGLYQFIPALVLTIPAGQWVDRANRVKLLGLSLGLQLVVGLALGWASLGGWASREVLLAACVVLGIVRSVQMPAQQAIIPSLVEARDLPRALALNVATLKISVIGGPALGGFIYLLGPAATYGACAVFGLASLACLLAVHMPARPRPQEPVTWATLLAGLDYVWRNKVVLGAISLDLFAVVLGGVYALMPMFAKDVLQTGPWGLGLLRAAPSVGGLLVAAWLARNPLSSRVGHWMFGAVAVYGAALLAFAFSHWLWLSLALLALSGGADMVSVVIRQSLVQLETPDEMRGRVGAVNATFISASNQLGDFRAGVTAEWLGAIAAVVVGGMGTLLVVALWIRLFPALARRERLVSE
jgi:MFS family permease